MLNPTNFVLMGHMFTFEFDFVFTLVTQVMIKFRLIHEGVLFDT